MKIKNKPFGELEYFEELDEWKKFSWLKKIFMFPTCLVSPIYYLLLKGFRRVEVKNLNKTE